MNAGLTFLTLSMRLMGLIQCAKVSQTSHFSALPPRLFKIFLQLVGIIVSIRLPKPTGIDEAGFMRQYGRGVFGEKISESLLKFQRGKGIATAKMLDVEAILLSTRDRTTSEV
jgi:hypothetical protein